MSGPKRGNAWLSSSFDFDSPPTFKVPAAKKPCSEDFYITKSNHSAKNRPTNSLSALLSSCEPQKPADLAISRQKQKELSNWFVERPKFGKPIVLIISGPSGCGKTAALRVIAKEHKFDIVEWITPMDQAENEFNRISRQGERFEDFLLRATRYSSAISGYTRRLLMVKDIPNSYIEGKENFNDLLTKYYRYGKEPLVFVSTETGDSRLLTNIFSQNVRNQFGIDFININAVTQASLKNILKRVASILNSKASELLCVTQDKINEVLSNNIGDVRSALLNIIFASLKIPNDKNLKSDCGSREETLGLLHGVGRVINPKRKIEGNVWRFTHDPDELALYFQTMSQTAISFIHENCLGTIGENMNAAESALEAISLADILSSEWRDNKVQRVALSYCIRGVMVANDSPVSQWNPVRKASNVAFGVKRNLERAEKDWYGKFIESKTKKVQELPIEEVLSQSLIEEFGDW